MLFKNLLFFLVVITQLNCYGQTKLSRLEKKILKQVSLNQENAIIFLEKVVNINSGTLNKKGVRMVGDVFRNAFDDINFSTQWMEMPEEMNRAVFFKDCI